MRPRCKQAELRDCSRSYLEHLVSELERSQARGETINLVYLEEARAAIATAPDYFIEHGY